MRRVDPVRTNHAPSLSGLIGLLVAAAIAGTLAVAEVLVLGSTLMAIGVVVASPLGYVLGRRAATFEEPAETIFVIAALSVLGGAACVSVVFVIPAIVADPSITIAIIGFVFVFAAGLIAFGLPALAITLICGTVWYVAVRRISKRMATAT